MDERKRMARQGAGDDASHIPVELLDEALLDDIELLMRVIAGVATRPRPLTARQVDRLLGVELGDAADG